MTHLLEAVRLKCSVCTQRFLAKDVPSEAVCPHCRHRGSVTSRMPRLGVTACFAQTSTVSGQSLDHTKRGAT